MKTFTASVDSKASLQQAWRAWIDLPNWPDHDPTLGWIKLDKFEEGARGKLKPKSAPFASTIIIENIVKEKCFDIRTPLPGCSMISRHEIAKLPSGGTKFIFTAEFTGPLAGLFFAMIGKGIQKNVGPTMELLSNLAVDKY